MMETKKTLSRDTDNKMLGGVASGLAEYMNWDVTVVRLIFLFCLFAVQGSVLAYILAWIIVPGKYDKNGGLGFGKILLLLFVCALPIILFTLVFGAMILGMFATIL
jgi:phage shock protein PspC (stress-responsive transcriptional regulator)